MTERSREDSLTPLFHLFPFISSCLSTNSLFLWLLSSSLSVFLPVCLLLHHVSTRPLLSPVAAYTTESQSCALCDGADFTGPYRSHIPTWNRLTVSCQHSMGRQRRASQITTICAHQEASPYNSKKKNKKKPWERKKYKMCLDALRPDKVMVNVVQVHNSSVIITPFASMGVFTPFSLYGVKRWLTRLENKYIVLHNLCLLFPFFL